MYQQYKLHILHSKAHQQHHRFLITHQMPEKESLSSSHPPTGRRNLSVSEPEVQLTGRTSSGQPTESSTTSHGYITPLNTEPSGVGETFLMRKIDQIQIRYHRFRHQRIAPESSHRAVSPKTNNSLANSPLTAISGNSSPITAADQNNPACTSESSPPANVEYDASATL